MARQDELLIGGGLAPATGVSEGFSGGFLSDFGQDITAKLKDPEVLKFLGGIGSALSQGKGAGEALDPSAFVAAKVANEAEKRRRVAAGGLLQPAIGQAGTTPTIEPTTLAGAAAIPQAEPGISIPSVTPLGQPGADETLVKTTPDGTITTIKAGGQAPSPAAQAGQALAPTAQPEGVSGLAEALGPQAPAAIPSQARTAPPPPTEIPAEPVAIPATPGQPVRTPARPGILPVEKSPFEDVPVEDLMQILQGLQTGRTSQVGDVTRNLAAGTVTSSIQDEAGRSVRRVLDAQGRLISTEDLGSATSVQAAQAKVGSPKGERYVDTVTNEFEWVPDGAVPKNENAIPVKNTMTQEQLASNEIRLAKIAGSIIDGINPDTKEAISVEASLPLINTFNASPLSPNVIIVKPGKEALSIGDILVQPSRVTEMFGEEASIYVASKTPESEALANKNTELFNQQATKASAAGIPSKAGAAQTVRRPTAEALALVKSDPETRAQFVAFYGKAPEDFE